MANDYINYSVEELHEMYKTLVAGLTKYLEANAINALRSSIETGKVVISFDNPVLLEEMFEIAKRMVAIEKRLRVKQSYFDVIFTPEMFKAHGKDVPDIVAETYAAYSNYFAERFKNHK